MSSVYIERLRHIQSELNAAKSVIAYVSTNLHKAEIIAEASLTGYSRDFLEQVGKNLEMTYFVRLTAEFEGVLKDHLSTNHPTYAFPIDRAAWKVDLFLSTVWRKEHLPRNAQLRQKLDEVRSFRNSVAHRGHAATPVTFGEALKRYNTFLAKLPEPRS